MVPFLSSKFLLNIRLRYVIIITLLLALILFLIAFFGIERSKTNMLKVMEREGIALLGSLILSSQNTIRANALVEEIVGERLLNIAHLVGRAEKEGDIDNSRLQEIAERSNLLRIDVLDPQMNLVYSSDPYDTEIYQDTTTLVIPMLKRILEEGEAEVAFGIEAKTLLAEKSYAAAIQRVKEKGVVVVVTSAAYMESFKKEIGIGYLIQKISQESGVEYIVLQSREGIVLASKKVEKMLKIEEDPFLQKALSENEAKSRIVPFEGGDVLEVVKPFTSEEIPSGIFRIGLSLAGYREVASSYQRQMILFAIVLFILGLLTIGIVIVNQNYFVLDRSYKQIKTLTGNILEGMHSAVVAVDKDGKIIMFNHLAEEIFSIDKEKVINHDYASVFPNDDCLLRQTLEKERTTRDVEREFRTFSGEDKFLIIGTSCLFDEEKKFNGAVAVIHDVTELKKYEEEAKRTERLSALGNLAAGVAHEVRNPLNAISIAAQRLKSEFVPQKGEDEYITFTKTILNEIKRLDNIINQFLGLAKAQKLDLTLTNMNAFLDELVNLIEIEAKEKNILLTKRIGNLSEIKIDPEEMKKAILNIMRNGVQATPPGKAFKVQAFMDDSQNQIVIKVEDSGPGIPKENLSKIFQPYFSTKEKGTGLGLSIAYRIISDHKGKIEVESELGKGTVFTVKLPI
ncbi:MAG: ATP-binding protein [Candidatus Zixiibacteriota bacterium]